MTILKNIVGICTAACLGFSVQAQETDPKGPEIDPKFAAWLEGVRVEAREKGISEETISVALADVKILKRVISSDRNQPEIKQPFMNYVNSRVSEWRKNKGAEMLTEHADIFRNVAEQYGVPARYIASIWGLETNFGTYELTINAFDALATLSYDTRRAARFRPEIFAALEIIDKGYATHDQLNSSWAGALGQPQFMPVNYLKYAVDYDGDGKRDIWSNVGDTAASIANYLKAHGWQTGRVWGRPVQMELGSEATLPEFPLEGELPSAGCKRYSTFGTWRMLHKWNAMGVKRLNGDDLPDVAIPAALHVADKGDGKGYLLYDNFCTIMKYNPSSKYGVAVGTLGDSWKAIEPK